MWKYVIVLITLVGCSNPFQEMYPPIDKNFSSFEEAWYWVATNIKYKSDKDVHGRSEEWQTPEQTFYRKTGDCEDFAGLLGYFAKKLGMSVSVIGIKDEDGGHALLKVNGRYLEPSQYRMYYSSFYVLKYQTNEWDIDTFIMMSYWRKTA